MPYSYTVEIDARRTKVRELIALCFTHEEIARLLKVCPATVRNDCRRLGIWGQGNRSDAFSVKLRRFAELEMKPKPEMTAHETWLLLILEKNLGIAELRREGYHVSDALNYLMQPAYPEDRPSQVRFMESIFGYHGSRFSASDEWRDYLRALNAREIRTPERFHDLSESFVQRLCDKYRGAIMPIWSDDLDERIHTALATLSPREDKVVRLRFGIGVRQCMTHEELGREFGLTVCRIKQIESKALARLRHPSRSKFLSKFVTPVGDILVREYEAERLAADEEKRHSDVFNRSIGELELAVRTHNCLTNANIRTVGELVQKSESDLLKTKNFGRKALRELKEVLGEMGLHLHMSVAPTRQPLPEVVPDDPETKRVRHLCRKAIIDSPLPIMVATMLRSHGFETIGDIVRHKHEDELHVLPGIGISALNDIRRLLAFLDLRYGMEVPA